MASQSHGFRFCSIKQIRRQPPEKSTAAGAVRKQTNSARPLGACASSSEPLSATLHTRISFGGGGSPCCDACILVFPSHPHVGLISGLPLEKHQLETWESLQPQSQQHPAPATAPSSALQLAHRRCYPKPSQHGAAAAGED